MSRRARLLLAGVASVVFLGAGCRCRGDEERAPRREPAVVVVDPDDVAASAEPEREPNDDREQAQDLEEGKPVGGQIGTASRGLEDEDWYRVRVSEDKILTATLSGVAGLDLVLEALSSQGRRLVKVDNHGEGGGETLVNLAVSEGTYYLRVSGRAAGGGDDAGVAPAPGAALRTYRLAYRLRDREPNEELEPNWKMEWASTLALSGEVAPQDAGGTFGGEAVGYLGWHTDTDWYRVSLAGRAPGSLLRVEFDGVDEVRAQLAVHDGRAVLQRRVGRVGEPIVLPNLALPATLDSLFVVVRCGRQANVESQYALRVVAVVPPRPTEAEPNDAPAQATAISVDEVVEGIVADDQDRDHFALSAGGPVTVVVSPPAGVDVAVALVSAEGKVLWEVDAERAGGAEVLPAVRLRAPQTVLRVRAPRAADTDPLRSYRLLVRAEEQTGGSIEAEPNNRPDDANRWDVASPIRGYLHPDDDVDHFLLSCPIAGAPQPTVHVSGRRRRPTLLEVLDAAGDVVARRALPGAGDVLQLVLPATGGPCVLRVSGGKGGVSNSDPYELSLVP